MFSIAHSELGLRGYSVIFQHLKAVHYPKTTTCVVSLNIQMYLRGPFLLQTAPTILHPNFTHGSSGTAEGSSEHNLQNQMLYWVKN